MVERNLHPSNWILGALSVILENRFEIVWPKVACDPSVARPKLDDEVLAAFGASLALGFIEHRLRVEILELVEHIPNRNGLLLL